MAPCEFHRVTMQISGRQNLISFEMGQTRQPVPAQAVPGTTSFVPAGQPLQAVTSGDDFHAFQIIIPRDQMHRASEIVRGADAQSDTILLGGIGAPSSKLFRLIQLVYDVFRECGVGDTAMVETLVQAICIQLARDLETNKQHLAARQMSTLLRAKTLSLMEIAVDGSLSLGDLAEELGMKPSGFSRKFQASFGEKPSSYLSRLRLNRAQQMLRQTDAALVSISMECGFSSQAHMTTRFVEHFGITPAKYRARHSRVEKPAGLELSRSIK